MFSEKDRIFGKESLVKVAVVQLKHEMGKKKENVERTVERITEAADNGAGLVVLPECCTTGYIFNNRDEVYSLAENIPEGETTDIWIKLAAEKNVYIASGIVEKEGNKLYNSAVLIGPEGYIGKYRKMHLWDEDKLWFEPGNLGLPVFHTKIGRIALLICYDMWFPEMFRIAAVKGADIICTANNWLETEGLPADMGTLAPHMAMVAANNNAIFIASAARAREIERGVASAGRSVIVNPSGMPSAGPANMEDEKILYADCNLADARKLNLADHTVVLRDRRTDYYDEMLGTDETKLPR